MSPSPQMVGAPACAILALSLLLMGCTSEAYGPPRDRVVVAGILTPIDDPPSGQWKITAIPTPTDLPGISSTIEGGFSRLEIQPFQWYNATGKAYPEVDTVLWRRRANPVADDQVNHVTADVGLIRFEESVAAMGQALKDGEVLDGFDESQMQRINLRLDVISKEVLSGSQLNLVESSATRSIASDNIIWRGMTPAGDRFLQTTMSWSKSTWVKNLDDSLVRGVSSRDLLQRAEQLNNFIADHRVNAITPALRGFQLALDLWETNVIAGLASSASSAQDRREVRTWTLALRAALLQVAITWRRNQDVVLATEQPDPILIYRKPRG